MHYNPYMGNIHADPYIANYKVMEANPNCPNPPCKIKYQRSKLSEMDIEGINAVYGCGDGKQNLCIKSGISI